MSLNIRLEEIRKYSGKNVSSFGSQFVSIGVENIRKLIKNPNANPSYSFIVELLEKYPEINYKWLLFGEGEMLDGQEKPNSGFVVNEAQEEYGGIAELRQRVEKLENQNALLELLNRINKILPKWEQEAKEEKDQSG